MNLKNSILLGLALFLIGLGVGRYALPTKTTTETSKEVDKNHETIDRDVTAPDGTKTHEHIVKDETKKKTETSIVVENKKPDWRVSALGGYSFNDHDMVYGMDVQRRVLGTLSVGAFALTNKTVGISIGYEF